MMSRRGVRCAGLRNVEEAEKLKIAQAIGYKQKADNANNPQKRFTGLFLEFLFVPLEPVLQALAKRAVGR